MNLICPLQLTEAAKSAPLTMGDTHNAQPSALPARHWAVHTAHPARLSASEKGLAATDATQGSSARFDAYSA